MYAVNWPSILRTINNIVNRQGFFFLMFYFLVYNFESPFVYFVLYRKLHFGTLYTPETEAAIFTYYFPILITMTGGFHTHTL